MATTTESETGTTGTARTGGSDGAGLSRSRAADAFEAARERTYSAYETARGRAAEVTRQAADQVAVYPVAAVIGGFALGALLAFLAPRTERENRLLGSTGRRIAGTAREAAARGLDAGREQIDQIRSKAAQKVGEAVVDAVGGKQ